jgi:exoribonuclease II
MQHDVVAFPRRERVCLAAVVSETRAPDGSGMLVLVAEDGAKFPFHAAQALVRATDVPQQGTDTVPQWLARVREASARPIDWRALHAQMEEGAEVGLDRLAEAAGLSGDTGRLAVALASADSDPWFRRDGSRFVAAPRGQAEARLARATAQRRDHEEDAALLAWWPQRAESAPPAGCRGALDAVAAFAMRGAVESTNRGRVLAAKLSVPEPDQALEALVLAHVLPEDVNPAPQRAGLDLELPRAALADAARIAASPVDSSGREDLTSLYAVAVDDADTTEVDDAISLREDAGGLEVLVHIADVAAAISAGTALDRAACERASSMYAPDAAVPMLPEATVERLSLGEGAVREAVTGIFRVSDTGKVAHARFVRSLVRVTKRLTYEETAAPAALAATEAEGRRLVATAEHLRAARREAGAILVQTDSLKVGVEDGVAQIGLRRQDTPGDLVVGELMVLFNREAGRLLAAADAPAFFRTQAEPREPEPARDDPLYALRARRRFAPANVTVEPARHHGVGADAYVQATSPLRRYADLVNQRQIAAVAAGAKPPHVHADLERLVARLVERERTVRIAADDRTDHWLARHFEKRVGETIPGVLSRVPRRGMGSVWVPSLSRELPLRPPADWTPPPEGTAGQWRIARVQPWRGRVELAPEF